MMKKNIYAALAIFNFTLYLSMKSIWSGIEGMFKIHALQYIFLGLICGLLLFSIIIRYISIHNGWLYGLISLSAVFTIALFYMLYLGIDSYRYFVRAFVEILLMLFLIYAVYFFIFKYPKCRLSQNRPYQRILLGTVVALILVVSFDLDFHYTTNKPVVYAVEDTYQIVWTTSTPALASVTVGEDTYYDLYAGTSRSETMVHKVTVPMSVLDNEKSYTISSTHVLFRGPYSGILGGKTELTFAFKPVDLSDGLNYYTLSDTHTQNKSAIQAASYFGDELDFLILAGDIMNHIERPSDAEVILKLGYEVTKGEKPVIYARGNHEVKGEYHDQLHRYVGSLNEKFYYTFTLTNIFGVVLDLGEDHADDWWEYYGTAHYEQYRNEQTEFLNQIITDKPYDDPSVVYRLGICHIPVTFVEDEYLDTILNQWTMRLNEIGLDLMISGHKHQLLAFTTDIPALIPFKFNINYDSNELTVGYRTNADFANIVASRRSMVQSIEKKENFFGNVFTGLAIEADLLLETQKITFTNSDNQTVSVVDPYSGETYEHYNITFNPFN